MDIIKVRDKETRQWVGIPALAGPKGDKGDTGAQGPAGADGYTPQRGVDYWTAEDQQVIVNDVLAALPTWTGGSY